jgi:hypothetical protein
MEESLGQIKGAAGERAIDSGSFGSLNTAIVVVALVIVFIAVWVLLRRSASRRTRKELPIDSP